MTSMCLDENDWFTDEAKHLIEKDIWKAKNFITTAKTLCAYNLKLEVIYLENLQILYIIY